MDVAEEKPITTQPKKQKKTTTKRKRKSAGEAEEVATTKFTKVEVTHAMSVVECTDGYSRCGWCLTSKKPEILTSYVDYHDNEWGVAVKDDRLLFEMLCLEGQQAGLSWSTILMKRQGYRDLFANFDIPTIAKYTKADVDRLVVDQRIIRSRLKIESIISNAQSTSHLFALFLFRPFFIPHPSPFPFMMLVSCV